MTDSTTGPPGPRLVVGAAIVDDLHAPTRLLAARRSAPARLAGGWEFPGGKVEPGEQLCDALHRELVEELGVRIEVGAPVTDGPVETWPLSTAPDGSAWQMRVWLARITRGEPQMLEDHDALRWLTRPELFDVPWLPADIPIVRRIADVFGAPPRS